MKTKVGFVGWRGMVGSVLLDRLFSEGDLDECDLYFFSSNLSSTFAKINNQDYMLLDASSIDDLFRMDIVVATQGSKYTETVFHQLRQSGWSGYWIDAASTLRLSEESCIALDPVNHDLVKSAIQRGIKTFVGGNCAITLVMIGIANLLKDDLIESINMITFQAASGAGASHVKELLMQQLALAERLPIADDSISVLQLMQRADEILKSDCLPRDNFKVNIVNNIIPWIDEDLGNGSSKEEWKSEVELNKILGFNAGHVKVDGYCVRVDALRCHSAAITMKFRQDVSLQQISDKIASNRWVRFINNDYQNTIHTLTPTAVSGSLMIHVGRLKKLSTGDNSYGTMIIGDQLLWGAAEPLRCVLNMLL